MSNYQKFYINGKWVVPQSQKTQDVINPATESFLASVAMGNEKDVDIAVKAARDAFESFSQTSVDERKALLSRVIECYQALMSDLAKIVMQEMGAPISLAMNAQVPAGLGQLEQALRALNEFEFAEDVADTKVIKEPIGVCGLITPWNWPLNQIAAKVGPALAAGCTMVLKPSEIAPLNALIFAEIMHEAGAAPGVFNLINGDGPTVGVAMSCHPDIDMISITGSIRAGISVMQHAAPTVKRVIQELGGKSPNLILDDADFETSIARDTFMLCMNTGQTCDAPTRMLVPQDRMQEAAAIARATVEQLLVGDPTDEKTQVGPLASSAQFEKVQALIKKGIDEGATLEAGGLGRPDGKDKGYFVKPTIFSNVTNDMTIAKEEIFGPVLSLIGYTNEDEAIQIANDTPYGLGAYISSNNHDRAVAISKKIKAGYVRINGAQFNQSVPFGGYKQSGNGREFGKWGLEEFLETKSILGHNNS